MKDLLQFEIRNRNKLIKYFLFGIICSLVLTGITFGIDYSMNLVSNQFLNSFNNPLLFFSVTVITTILLALQLNKTDEFESSSTVGISERKERGMLLYLSRATTIFIITLYVLCICL